MIGPADIEAWTEDLDTTETTIDREKATDRTAAHPPHSPSAFSVVEPLATSLARPFRQALERLRLG